MINFLYFSSLSPFFFFLLTYFPLYLYFISPCPSLAFSLSLRFLIYLPLFLFLYLIPLSFYNISPSPSFFIHIFLSLFSSLGPFFSITLLILFSLSIFISVNVIIRFWSGDGRNGNMRWTFFSLFPVSEWKLAFILLLLLLLLLGWWLDYLRL